MLGCPSGCPRECLEVDVDVSEILATSLCNPYEDTVLPRSRKPCEDIRKLVCDVSKLFPQLSFGEQVAKQYTLACPLLAVDCSTSWYFLARLFD